MHTICQDSALKTLSGRIHERSQVLAKSQLRFCSNTEIFVSAEILLKLRFMKGISAETKISAKF